MGANSKIEWTHHSFNPWRGCTKVSQGCKHCYAETLSGRNPAVLGVWGPQGSRPIAAPSYWKQPIAWNREAEQAGVRRRVFCASLADVFEGEDTMPAEAWLPVQEARGRLWELIEETPMLDWLLLTKRPENIVPLATQWRERWPANVWMGTSVEDQAQADKRIPELLKVPAAVRFLSCEPLLGPVDLFNWIHGWCFDCGAFACVGCTVMGHRVRHIHWVIAGGESGPGARPMHPAWASSLRDQCQAAGVAFHFKQWGEWRPFNPKTDPAVYMDSPDSILRKWHPQTDTWHAGKKAAGRELDGRTWDQFPKVVPA